MKKILIFGIVILFIGMSTIPPIGGIVSNPNILIDNKTKVSFDETSSANNETEYWALLIAVGVYAGHPNEDRPSMLTNIEPLHDMLLVSSHWKEENIKVITGENATLWNILKGFRWLNQKEDENDFSLVYITTHGGQFSRDRFPWDEKDKMDELLVTHRGFQYPWTNIRDDFLNLLLSLLNSKGVCVIVDSCFAGGFNDKPYFTGFIRNKKDSSNENSRVNASEWMQEIGKDLQGKGRVVLMSCREDELSAADTFTPLLTESLRGYADTNEDKIVTAEEAFTYIKDNIETPGFDMHPTIFDNFPGELQLTEVELPPTIPENPIGQIIGETNTTYNYSTVSIDPEGNKIKYGWDLNSDDIVDEWSDFLNSAIRHNISRSWSNEGSYNIKVKAVDERGVESEWSNRTVVSMSSDYIPDQRQTVYVGGGIGMVNSWVAQSFIPTLSTLSKVELGIGSWGIGEPKLIHMYIRDKLKGENLVEVSQGIPPFGYFNCTWSTFDFEDINVTPGEIYYIVTEKIGGWGYLYRCKYGDPYAFGNLFLSGDGNGWDVWEEYDGCFVTWGKI